MTITEQIAGKNKSLPQEKQHEVLLFVETLVRNPTSSSSPDSLRGLWAEFGIDISEEDINEARVALWIGFSRDRS